MRPVIGITPDVGQSSARPGRPATARYELKQAYAEKIGKVLSATKTARYIQMETKMRAVIKVDLAKSIPLVY